MLKVTNVQWKTLNRPRVDVNRTKKILQNGVILELDPQIMTAVANKQRNT